ncbi:MAG TPA: hypothetical protein ENI54_04355 [bacterium]|nr:hypothetical protein [bacterium]
MGKTAVFIGMTSIQKYIFASNKLKENIGASYKVKDIFDKLRNKFDCSYIGGGNALIYFNSLENAEDAMKDWSRTLLQSAPGIIPNITIDDKFDDSNYSESRAKLIRKAKMQENRSIPQTELSSLGITTDCPRSGLSAEIWGYKPKNEEGYISSINYTKILASEESKAELEKDFSSVINDFEFTDEIDKLGGSVGENNHIAIVHIDGNDLGEKFKEEADEKGVQAFSTKLKEAVKNAFGQTLEKLILLKEEEEISFTEKYLPVRPIVIGGDDVTFVCDARVGMFLTVEFIKAFEEQGICKDKNITACAGISIVKTKYPFYRAYKMAEALCGNAKRERKLRKKEDSSFIDFHISFGGLGGSIEEIRDTDYRSADNKILYMRPYSIDDISNLLRCLTSLSELPQSNIKKLREVLYVGEAATTGFIKELKYRDKILPCFSNSDESETGFSNNKSPYMDMIELIDFYPKTLLNLKREGI